MRALGAVGAIFLLTASLASAQTTQWSGSAQKDGESWPVAFTLTLRGEEASALVDLPSIDAYARPFRGSFRRGVLLLERVSPSGAALRIEGAMEADTFKGRWIGFGLESDLRLQRQASVPPLHRETEVSFRNGDVRLSGTLILPPAKGRYPAVVFVHGAGPQTRAYDISHAVYLARQGIAALVYDKRGTGASAGEWESASLHDLAADAVSGAELLAAHPEVRSVGVWGYSQGGWIGPLAATISARFRFVIAGGLSGVNPMEQTVHHRTGVMKQAGFDQTAIEQAIRLWRRLWDSTLDRLDRDVVAAEIANASRERWFASSALPHPIDPNPAEGVKRFLLFEPAPVWRTVHVPVWLYWGDADIHVPVKESQAIIARELIAGNNPHFTFRTYAQLDHSMRSRTAAGFHQAPADLLPSLAQWIVAVSG